MSKDKEAQVDPIRLTKMVGTITQNVSIMAMDDDIPPFEVMTALLVSAKLIAQIDGCEDDLKHLAQRLLDGNLAIIDVKVVPVGPMGNA
jgi:hypothetical protein